MGAQLRRARGASSESSVGVILGRFDQLVRPGDDLTGDGYWRAPGGPELDDNLSRHCQHRSCQSCPSTARAAE